MPYPGYYREPLLPDTIRLLRLLPSEDRAGPIQCELFHYPLQEIDKRTHPYEALSYAWGRSDNPQYISIGEHNSKGGHYSTSKTDLRVTQNLHAALLRLRYQTHERVIWIDAVCINQNDQQEKEQQIQFMAKIYALANGVVVWLGEAAEDSDRALDWIRGAGGDESGIDSSDKTTQEAVVALLRRPWFRRIWVLQEVAAARQILIMCGPTEVDGHAFCLGVDVFVRLSDAYADLQSLANSVNYLIRGAIFRPKYSMSTSGRSSLDIRPLGELVDMYHTHDATISHDKLYALLGMCTDDIGQTDLLPDYSVPWEVLFQRLIKYLLCEDTSVKIKGVDRELAVIERKGRVLAKIELSQRKTSEFLGVRPGIGDESLTSFRATQSSAKPVRDGDLICLLEGASNPMVIRPWRDHFEVIAICFDWSGDLAWAALKWSGQKLDPDFTLLWDWSTSSTRSEYKQRCDQVLKVSTGLEGSLEKIKRARNVARALVHAGNYDEAQKTFREATEIYETAFGIPNTGEIGWGFTPLSWAAKNGHDAVVRLLVAKDGIDLDLKHRGLDSSWARPSNERGRTAKHPLEIGLNEVDSLDGWFYEWSGRTPISWAAAGGHETVVKLLLQTDKAEVNSTDVYRRTPLSWAAEGGHYAVVKLLLETGKANVNYTDVHGRTPLSWAAAAGHETIIRLLLETGKAKVIPPELQEHWISSSILSRIFDAI